MRKLVYYVAITADVFSRSLTESPDPRVEIASEEPAAFVRRLKECTGKDIFLCGAIELATQLFAAKLVDDMILKVNPLLLGANILLGPAASAWSSPAARTMATAWCCSTTA